MDLQIGKPEDDIGEHLITLYNLALQSPTQNILELGVRGGVSTRVLGLACKVSGRKLYSVDCDLCANASAAMEGLDLKAHWKFAQADDRDLEKVVLSFSQPFPEQFGMIFVDTSHEYEHTKKEIELYSPLVAKSGFLVFHDSYMLGSYHPGVSDPINEFLDSTSQFEVLKIFMNCNGLTILRRKNGATN